MTPAELQALAAGLGRLGAELRAANDSRYTLISAAGGVVARLARRPPQRAAPAPVAVDRRAVRR
jgi:hypothetical protein